MSARLSWGLRWRLSILWLLEWGITGAILTYLPLYFTQSGLSAAQVGQVMAVGAVGLWVAPFVVGQVCDRWLASEKYLAIAHFVGGVSLVSIPIATDMYEKTGDNFGALLVLVGIYATAYFPTMPLASALTFRHLPDPAAQFGKVRIWGTVGWVLAGLLLSLWLGRDAATEWVRTNYPEWRPTLAEFRRAISWMAPPESSDCFRIAALLSFALSSFCVFLPPSPPERSARNGIAPLQVFKLFRRPSFSMMIAVSFLLAIVVPLYSLEVPRLLEAAGYEAKWVPAVMTIGQISEFPALLVLPLFLRIFGLKWTFALGMLAWVLRYGMFALGKPEWVMLAAISLHGVCHVFLIIVIQLFVDQQCPRDLRATGQNLFAFITAGIAMPVGFLLGGKLAQWCTHPESGMVDYQLFFSVPASFILILLLVYAKWFPAAAWGRETMETKTLPPKKADELSEVTASQ